MFRWQVDGSLLFTLGEPELQELGITSGLQRKRLLLDLKKFKEVGDSITSIVVTLLADIPTHACGLFDCVSLGRFGQACGTKVQLIISEHKAFLMLCLSSGVTSALMEAVTAAKMFQEMDSQVSYFTNYFKVCLTPGFVHYNQGYS